MPFKSAAQRRLMHARHPEIAKRWREESGPQRNLRERAPKKKAKGGERDRLIEQFVAKHRK